MGLDMNFPRTARLMILIASFTVVGACATPSSLPDPLEAGWKGEPVCEQINKGSDQRILRCTFPPTVGHERHFHTRHFGYTVAGGRMRVTDSTGTREVEMATGSSYSSDGVEWHEAVNVGSSTAVFLIIELK